MWLKNDIPENHGISSRAILGFLEETEADKDINLINFILLRDANILAQFCKKPYEANCKQLLFSMTKSFSSLGIGIAIDKGYLDLCDTVISFFSDKLPEVISDNLKKLTIHNLLTMSAGIHDNTYSMLYPQKDWVKAFLAQDFPHAPGTYYRYSTHASHMLSAIIEKATEESLLEFLDKYLFEPLDITKPQWETSPMGTVAGGMGISLTAEDIAKVGIMLLNKGKYQGKQIISEQYINLATSAQVSKINDISEVNERVYSGSQYGYQFHIGLNGCYRADGAFGQICFVAPKDRTVIVATSRGTNVEKLLQLIYKYLLGHDKDNIPADETVYKKLQNRLATLEYEVPKFKEIPEGIPSLKNCTYNIEENPNGVEKIILNKSGVELSCNIIYHDMSCNNLCFNLTNPVYGKDSFVKDIQIHEQKYISYASWEEAAVLVLNIIYIETPYIVTYRITFNNDTIELEFKMNVSLNLKNFTAIGKLNPVQSCTNDLN